MVRLPVAPSTTADHGADQALKHCLSRTPNPASSIPHSPFDLVGRLGGHRGGCLSQSPNPHIYMSGNRLSGPITQKLIRDSTPRASTLFIVLQEQIKGI